MDQLEPFQDNIDFSPATATFGVEGIQLDDLREGVELEIDEEMFGGGDDGEENQREKFNKDETWRYLNLDCMLSADGDIDMPPFKYLETVMEDLTDEGGVFKRVAKGGVGNAIPEGSTVRIHYNGYLEYSDEPYDSTRLRNKPLTLHLGTGGAIPGLEIGVSTMKKGELAHILVKPEYAFGKMGCPPRIPPEATILFEVEVLSFHDQQAAEGYEAMPKEKKEKLDLKELIDVANSERESGNDYFQRNIFGKAAQCYTKGIGVLETARLKDEEEEREWSDALMKLHLNMALCALRQKKPKLCIVHCRRALELDQHNVKAVFRLGQAYSIMGEWECSKRHLLRAAKLAPKNLEIRQELANLNRMVKQFETIEKGMYSRMFQTESDTAADHEKSSKSALSEELKTSLKNKMEMFQKNYEMREMVLPLEMSREEVEYIEGIAADMDSISTQRGTHDSAYSLKVFKPDMIVDEES